jgi:isoamylase
VRELPVRPADGGAGVDLIAEPWGIGAGAFQLGEFPTGWAEWNGAFRDTIRSVQNKAGVEPITLGHLASRVAGSSDLFEDDGRRPWHSINFIASHDGFTLRDVYAYNDKVNDQPWPYGPSDGGEDQNRSWDQGGSPERQRQAARTGLALLMVSAGVPMITGGDEMYRTQRGNNNAYNVDSELSWLDYSNLDAFSEFANFARDLIALRTRYEVLRPAHYRVGRDHDGNGLADLTWHGLDGGAIQGSALDDRSNRFLAWRLDAEEAGDDVRSIYVAYNGWPSTATAHLPAPAPGLAWYRVSDTAAWDEDNGNFRGEGDEDLLAGPTYDLTGRSVLILIER